MRQLSKWLVCGVVFFLFTVSAKSDYTFIPESHHHQFTSFGTYIEDGDSMIAARDAKRATAVVGAALPIIEVDHWKTDPELILFASATAGYHLNDKLDTLLTETIDARVGLSYEFHLSEKSRMLVGWTHQSGHVSDNIEDLRMVGPNLGNEIIQIRFVHDIEDKFRLGAILRPIIGSEPTMKVFASTEFAEWYPFGTASNFRKPTPFLAVGLEQYGTEKIHFTTHIQTGFYIGSHLEKEHHTLVRGVIGYYHGVDPRLKFAQYLLQMATFGYIGVAVAI